MSVLFSPVRLGTLELSNRIVIAPMCMFAADHGLANDFHHTHYGTLAQSGAGLLIMEATAVEARGCITTSDLGLWSDAHADALRPVLAHIRRRSPMPVAIQLGHAGRKASHSRPWEGGAPLPPEHPDAWTGLSASAQPYAPSEPCPRSASLQEIAHIRQAFADAAVRAHQLGFDAIELHAAHGYLLHQFLSPLSNLRTDAYGGSLQARMRLTLEVFDAMQAALPAGFPLGVRLSATDWVDGGWDVTQTVQLSRALAARGCAFVHISSGGLHPAQNIPVAPSYQVPLADAVRRALGGAMPVIAVGMIADGLQAQAVLSAGQADAVAIGRGMLYNPRWPWEAARQLGAQVGAAPHYLYCDPTAEHGLFYATTGQPSSAAS